MKPEPIHFPTEEEKEAALAELFRTQAQNGKERSAAVAVAEEALPRLLEVMQGRSGQPYKLRGLLWSLYNGKPFSLIEVVNLDWEIRKDFNAVLLAWGHNDFFYRQLSERLHQARLWNWFVEEGDTGGEAA